MRTLVRRLRFAFATAVLLYAAGSAYGDTILDYRISGPGNTAAFNATFNLAQNPTPSGGGPLSFWFSSLPVNVNGTVTDLTVVFDSAWLGGGALSNDFFLVGPQLFSWSSGSSSPTMNVGTYTLFGFTAGTGGYYTVSVTDPPTGTPEPGSIALVMTALVALFGCRRLRRSS